MEKPLYILAANPIESNRIKRIFESGENSIMEMLRNPGQIRPSGWDLQTYDTPRIIKGEYLEVKDWNYKTLQLYEDGTFIFKAIADQSFLCWGIDDNNFQNDPRLNPLPLIEVTYNFVVFYLNLIQYFEKIPRQIKFTIELKNTFITETSKLYFFKDYFERKILAPENHMHKEFEMSPGDQLFKVGHIAFSIISRIYNWFGISSDEIPYLSKDENGNSIVDKENIIKLKKF